MIKIAKVIKEFIISFFSAFFTQWVEDFLILSGIALLVINTYLISIVETNILAGNYLLSAVLIFIGVVLAKR